MNSVTFNGQMMTEGKAEFKSGNYANYLGVRQSVGAKISESHGAGTVAFPH
jgi:hypothetical protein